MDFLFYGIMGLEILIGVAVIIAIVYLAARRMRIKKTETFEKRDN
jgi:hypothetical protein